MVVVLVVAVVLVVQVQLVQVALALGEAPEVLVLYVATPSARKPRPSGPALPSVHGP